MKKVREKLQKSQRIVVKIGTSSLMNENGTVNYQQFDRMAYVLSTLVKSGKEIILVSSGAIGVGMDKLHIDTRPKTIREQQAVAAVGQSEMMNLYSRFFAYYNQTVGQILLTRDVVSFPESLANVTNTFETLLSMNIIPIVNENDTVAVDELEHETKFGDNDQLSAVVAVVTKADVLLMLSDIDGFYNKNPNQHANAILYDTLHEVGEAELKQAGGEGSAFGTGGMLTKLRAAKHLLAHEQDMVLAKSTEPTILFDILDGKPIGTYFTPPQTVKEENE